jgi:hypothetical protein
MSWRLEHFNGINFHDIKPDIENSFLWKSYIDSGLNIYSFASVLQKNIWENPSYLDQHEYKKLVKELESSNCFKSFVDQLYLDFSLKIEKDENGNFLQFLHIDNIPKLNVHYFIDNLIEICEFLSLDLGTFITNFNKLFSYYIEDFPSEITTNSTRPGGLINFNKYFNLDINNLNINSLKILLKKCCTYPFDPEIVSFSFSYFGNKSIYPIVFHFNIETLFLQYWYKKQYPTDSDLRIFSDKRKLHWMDFDSLIVKKLNDETIKKIMDLLLSIPYIEGCLFHLESYGKHFALSVLLKKVENNIEDIFAQDLIKECSDFILYLKSKIVVTDTLNSTDELSHKKYIVDEFSKGVYKVVSKVKDELELISMVIILNEMFLNYIKTNDEVILEDFNKAIWIMTKYGKKTYTDEEVQHLKYNFSTLNLHTKCCFDQILLSCYDNINKQYYTNRIQKNNNLTPFERFLPIFKDTISYFLTNNNCNLCKDYYQCLDKGTKFVFCNHKTISYYAYSKWWYLYKVMIEKYYSQNITELKWNEMVQNTFQVWYPKQAYCDKCHYQYKNYEEIVFNTTKGIESLFKNLKKSNISKSEKISNEMLYVAFNAQVSKFRLLYADNCDIPFITSSNDLVKININHKIEIDAKNNNFNQILSNFLNSIKQEINFINTKKYW